MTRQVKYIIEIRDKFTKQNKKFQKEMKLNESSVKKFDTSLKSIKSPHPFVIKTKNKFSNTFKTYENDLKRLKGVNTNFVKSLGVVENKFKSLGQSLLTRVTAPLTVGGTASVLAFSKIEKGLSTVFTLLDKNQIQEFGKNLKLAQSEAIKLGFGVSDTNKALFDQVSALGVSEESLNIFKIAQKLAKGGNAELGVSVDGLTSIINAYGREVTSANEVANAFFTAQKFGKTTVAELAKNIGRVAPVAKSAGVSFQELLATISALTIGGINTPEATTALTGAISSLLKPGKEASDVLKALGLPVGATELKAVGLVNTLTRLNEVSEKYPDLIALAIPNITAFTGVNALSSDKLEILRQTVNQMGKDVKNGTGLNEAYKIQMMTLSSQLAKTKGAFTLLGNEIGNQLAPFVSILADGLINLTLKFKSLSPSTKKFIVIFGGLTALIAPILLGFGAFIGLIKLASIASMVLGVSLNASLFGIPLIIGGIISSIGLLIVKWDSIVERFIKLKGIVKDFFNAIPNAFNSGGSNVVLQSPKVMSTLPSVTNAFNSQNVDVSGSIKVQATPGTTILETNTESPNIGLNPIMVGGL